MFYDQCLFEECEISGWRSCVVLVLSCPSLSPLALDLTENE